MAVLDEIRGDDEAGIMSSQNILKKQKVYWVSWKYRGKEWEVTPWRGESTYAI